MNKLKKKRIEKKLTQEELARKINISTRTIQNLEKKTTENIKIYKKICNVLKCKIDDII